MLMDKELSVPMLNVVSSSIIICSALCVQASTCYGFSFRQTTGACQLHGSFVVLKSALGNRVWRARCDGPKPSVYCVPSCYCFIPTNVKKTWSGARSNCVADSSYLAKVSTRERLDLALSIMADRGVSLVWTGGYLDTTTNSWKWHDGELIDLSIFLREGGNCLQIWKKERKLDDYSCDRVITFICEKRLF